MKLLRIALALTTLLPAQDTKVANLLTKDIPEFAGKETIMLQVEYAPGGTGKIHRHNAHVFVYVLEGTVLMQVKGGQTMKLQPGQTFYETPQDIHTVGRNASNTKPAKLLVFMIKDKGAPVSVPVP